MISYLVGRLISRDENRIVLEVNGIGYEILVPTIVLRALEDKQEIRLYTFHYLEVSRARGQPILIGFTNEVEREFFKRFIRVSGVGPRSACQALSLPFSAIARAIDSEDLDTLTSLPGIGPKTARKIVAELQGKVGCFHLIQDESRAELPSPKKVLEEEGLKILLQLQYKRAEAVQMLRSALERSPRIDTIEDLMNEIYHQKDRDECQQTSQ